jgi:translation initiation factor 5B
MHGLEKQTLESLQLIRNKKTPFVVALNKIDRCYDWKMVEFNNVRDALDLQAEHT